MASQTSHDFPLATEDYYNGDGASGQENSGAADHAVDSEAGASGDSSGAISISEEALIAIIVVVSIIAALGSKSSFHFGRRETAALTHDSRNGRSLLCRQKARVENQRKPSPVGA